MEISNIVQISVPQVPSQPWTSVTNSDEFVSHLIQLYFTWEAPFYDIVQKEVFLPDMKAGNPETSSYCSQLLVNAMLATACLHSDREESFQQYGEFGTAGNHFFEEAARLWKAQGDTSTSLTTMEALVIMHYFEVNRGNDGVGLNNYLGIATKMYEELSSGSFYRADSRGRPLQLEWPCWKIWNCRCVTACVLRHPYMIPPPKLPRPRIPGQVDLNDVWQPYPHVARSYPYRSIELAHHCIDMAFVIRDISLAFYSKNAAKPDAATFITLQNKLLKWYNNYLQSFTSSDGNMAPQIVMRFCYHSMEIHVFRGTMSDGATVSSETSQMISTALEAASASAKLQKMYSQLYGAKGTIMITYDAFQSALVSLYFLELKEYEEAFIQSSKVLSRLGKKRTMSALQLWMIGLLAKREGIILPAQVIEMLGGLAAYQSRFENSMSFVPMPATSKGSAALRQFKEELLERESAMYGWQEGASGPVRGSGNVSTRVSEPLGREDLLEEMDPTIGGLTEVYQKWTLFGD
ncbi:hypothetical protein ABW19_dt0209332 [Dactylella cylindrospora]|nr:hypothetical protein ABW19_dt0209332 [Dactylella cylindrospora]